MPEDESAREYVRRQQEIRAQQLRDAQRRIAEQQRQAAKNDKGGGKGGKK